MKYIIYLDSFFIINFSMDLISILICKKLACRKNGMARSVAAAAFGGIFACTYVIIPYGNNILRMLLTYIIAIAIMVLIAFGYKSRKRFIQNIIMLYIVAFLSGGISNFLYFGLGVKSMPVIMIIAASIGSFAVGVAGRKKDISRICYDITIVNRGISIEMAALVDTGNSLKEPYLKRPVNILEGRVAVKLIEGDDIHLQKGYMKIPFRSLGKENGLIDGFEVEKIYINMPAEVICRERVVIGVYNGRLSSDESYSMILNPELLKEI